MKWLLLLAAIVALASSQCHDADYDSGWFSFSSQAGTSSFKEVFHGLPDYPGHVEVYVRTVGGLNPGYIFQAVGASQHSDDSGNLYGGVVYAYDSSRVRLWAPQANNGNNTGHIVYFGYKGWANEVAPQVSHTADVRVLAWRDNYAGAAYDSGWFTFSSQAGSSSYKSVSFTTPFASLPGRVKVLVKSNSYPNKGFIFGALGSTMATDNYKNNYGGVVFAYNNAGVRLWAPTQRGKKTANNIGHIINIVDGWGGEVNSQRSDSASVRIIAWSESSLTPTFDSTWKSIAAQSSLSLQTLTFPTAVSSVGVPPRVKVLTRAITGNNNGYVFEAVGATQATDDTGLYGGIVFGYTKDEVSLFAPAGDGDNSTSDYNGRAVLVSNGWGNEINTASELTAEYLVQTFTCYNPPDTVECTVSSCLNSGACVEQINYFTCTCPSGFDGLRCERNIIPFANYVSSDGAVAFWRFSAIPVTASIGSSGFVLPASATVVSLAQRGNPSNNGFQAAGTPAYSASGLTLGKAFTIEVVFAPASADFTSGFSVISLATTSTNTTTLTISVTSDGRFQVTGSSGQVVLKSTPFNIAPGSTYHLALVVAPNRLYAYVNGVLLSGAVTAANLVPQGSYRLWTTANFHGILDELAVYNTALTAAKIQTHSNALATFLATGSLNQ